MARANVADGMSCASIRDAAKIHPSNAERDAHRVFDRYWLGLKVPITDFFVEADSDGGPAMSIPQYRVSLSV